MATEQSSQRPLYLGLDCSTQSLAAVVIDLDTHEVLYEQSLNFEKDLPHYKTHKGFLRHSDPSLFHAPPLMWVEALDMLFQQMRKDGVDLASIQGIGGSAQQHGSVYLNKTALYQLEHLANFPNLKTALHSIFSRPTSPIWMDSSTTRECEEIREALGGMENTIRRTGSNTFERFTGPQIRKFYKESPESYRDTHSIALISSFLASVLSGTLAPIDHGDGSGMNLMNIQQKEWDTKAVHATAPDLAAKLPPLVPSSHIIGHISPYFCKHFGFSPHTQILVWSGDNPNSVIGLGLTQDKMAGLSLGTSFTYFGIMKKLQLDLTGESHVFVSPTGDYMSLICFQNGALAIEALRRHYGIDWAQFNDYLSKTVPGNDGAILLPYFEPEIVPRIATKGLHRFHLREDDVPRNCRAIIEAQMLSIQLHSAWMKAAPSVIYATGGVSNNLLILQIAADILECPIIQLSLTKSTALGAAFRVAHALDANKRSWQEIVQPFLHSLIQTEIPPNTKNSSVYRALLETYQQHEHSFSHPDIH